MWYLEKSDYFGTTSFNQSLTLWEMNRIKWEMKKLMSFDSHAKMVTGVCEVWRP